MGYSTLRICSGSRVYADMGITSPASLVGRRSISGRFVRGGFRTDTRHVRRAGGARAAKNAMREGLIRKRGAPGLVGIQEKYNLNDPRLVWYRDEKRQDFVTDTREHGMWRKFAYTEAELADAMLTKDVHWLTGLGALDRIRIVLVGSQSAGNVGSVCRLASNFECRQVWLVNPECDYTADEARQMAMNPVAKSLLEDISIVKTIPEAIAECNMAVGFTRREGRQRVVDVPHGGLRVPDKNSMTALVFGREDDGLTNEELMYCTHTCRIPTTKWEGSLNVSHAVGITLARIFNGHEREERLRASHCPDTDQLSVKEEPVQLMEIHQLIRRLRHVLRRSNEAAAVVSKPEFTTPDRLLSYFRKILYRSRVRQREVNILHGFLTLVETNARTVHELYSDLRDKASDGEPEEEYEEFLEKAIGCQKALQQERTVEGYDYSETDEEEMKQICAELDSY